MHYVSARIIIAFACASALLAQSSPTASDAALADLSLEQLMNLTVQTAAMHPQLLGDAPASVTVITAEDIRKFGYRTLAEALGDARGFFNTFDHSYHFEGV